MLVSIFSKKLNISMRFIILALTGLVLKIRKADGEAVHREKT